MTSLECGSCRHISLPSAQPLACGVRNSTLRIGERVAAILVEYQIAGLQVNRILHFLRRGLVWAGQPGRIGDQIDLYFALCGYVASLLVISKIFAIDLIESRGIAFRKA